MELTHDYFQANLELLKEHHPLAWQTVIDFTGDPVGEFCLSVDGNPNLLVHDDNGEEIFLHDTKVTDAELAVYYALVPEVATGVAFFVGMGLGYTPRAMLKSHANLRHLAIFEPETGIFIRALQALDLTSLLSDHRLSIAIGPDIDIPAVLSTMARTLQLENLFVLRHLPCFKFSPQIYQEMHDEIYNRGNSYNISGNTTTTYGDKFIANRLRHLSAISHQQLLEHLSGAYAGVPAILVAAGPSLDKNIHLLQQAKGKALILAVDTALPAILAHGVTPDFTSCIDMDDITLEKIIDEAPLATDTSLICASWVTTLVPKNFPARQVYWTFSATNMESWLNNLLGGKVLTSGAGTVAQLNLTSALMMGCSPIIFVGQDLAFTDHAGHAQHTSLTSKEYQENIFERNEIIWVDGYGGVKVPTSRAYLGFKHHFEMSIEANKDRKFINATEGGVSLDGAEELPLQEVLTRYCVSQVDVGAVTRSADEGSKMPSRQRMISEFARMLKSIAEIEKDMTHLEDVVARLAKEISDLQEKSTIYKAFATLPLAIQRQLVKLDDLNASLDKAKVWNLLTEVTMEGLRQSERLNHEVKQLADNPEQYLAYLNQSINRFVVINQFRRQALKPFALQLKSLHEHLKRDHFLLKKFNKQKGGKQEETLLEILRLYAVSYDHIIIEKMIKEYCLDYNKSAELSFLLGTVAAHRCQFDKMEQCFSRTLCLDSSWSGRIAECRELLANRYIGFARDYQDIDQKVALRMFLKATRFTTTHPTLPQIIADEVTKILGKANNNADQNILPIMSDLLPLWCRELALNNNLIKIIGPEQAAMLYQCHGKNLNHQKNYEEAADAFANAVALAPQNAELHFLHYAAAFASTDFDNAVRSLDQAVAIDRQYAKYWEAIGDNLLEGDLPSDAVAAYEKCFVALPENIFLLKKIGNCYLSMNQLEAAREAYRFYQKKALSTETNTVQ